jgi:CheY-like chemotaxis protein
VLVAEDNPVNQRVVVGLLAKLGCEAIVVADGARAVASSQGGRFDVILMDCQMPELDGFEATRRIRAEQPGHVPIIALTAGALDGDRERCLVAGMDDYLAKPVRLEELAAALSKWVKPA